MMASSGDLISLYVGIELHSLALYVLAAYHRDDLKASEAGLKYFVLGALSSGLLLYGASLIYGFTGSMRFDEIAAYAAANESTGLIFGLVFLIAAWPSRSQPRRSTCGRRTSMRVRRRRCGPSSPRPPRSRPWC